MQYVPHGDHYEPVCADGALMLRPIQLALLQGLLDRPAAIAASRADLSQAAHPQAFRHYGRSPSTSCLENAIRRVIVCGWVARVRRGRKVAYALTPRGHEIVSGDVAVRLHGRGPWAPRSRRAAA